MKRIIAFLMSLLLALSLCACSILEANAPTADPPETTVTTEPAGTETTVPSIDATESTDPSTSVTEIAWDELAEKTGIDIEFEVNTEANKFIISLNWTNKLDTAAAFGTTYLLDVFQGENELCASDMTSDEFGALLVAIDPNDSMTLTLRFDLVDNSHVTIKVGDAYTNTYFSTFIYDLSAVG
jgi:ABC-type phosphate/phosphonate transport system substrate-binding protein